MKNDNAKFKIQSGCHSERSEESRSFGLYPQDDTLRRFYTFKFTFLILLAICYSLLAISPASAALVPCNGPVAGNGLPACTLCSFMQMISIIVLFIVRDITAPLAGLLFLIGGIMMVSAGGNETRFKKGKDIFKNTVVGVLIVLASWAIVNTLITTFGSYVSGFVPGNWWQVNCQ